MGNNKDKIEVVEEVDGSWSIIIIEPSENVNSNITVLMCYT